MSRRPLGQVPPARLEARYCEPLKAAIAGATQSGLPQESAFEGGSRLPAAGNVLVGSDSNACQWGIPLHP
jgi:hypothetical protein